MTEQFSRSKRTREKSPYTHQFTMRIRPEDRDRFDELAYRLRVLKGDAFQRVLDAAETMERVNEAIASRPLKP